MPITSFVSSAASFIELESVFFQHVRSLLQCDANEKVQCQLQLCRRFLIGSVNVRLGVNYGHLISFPP